MSELENRYSALFGTKTSKGRLQGGFFVLGTGALLGLVALVLLFFAFPMANSADKTTYYNLMKIALTSGPIACALIVWGASLTLPTRMGPRVASYVGLVFCLVASIVFLTGYPQNFNVAKFGRNDVMPLYVGVFAFGVVCMLSAFITSLLGYYLGRVQGGAGPAGGEGEEDIYGAGYETPDWVIERDIEYAMKKYSVEWGEGVAGAQKNSLNVNVPDSLGGNFVVGGLGKSRTIQVDSAPIDEASAKLGGARGNKKGAIPGEWADESVAALVQFRKQKAQNPKLFTPKTSFWSRVGGFFTGRNRASNGVATAPPMEAPKTAKPAAGGKSPPKRGKTIVIGDDEK
jgi:hypothetical protein